MTSPVDPVVQHYSSLADIMRKRPLESDQSKLVDTTEMSLRVLSSHKHRTPVSWEAIGSAVTELGNELAASDKLGGAWDPWRSWGFWRVRHAIPGCAYEIEAVRCGLGFDIDAAHGRYKLSLNRPTGRPLRSLVRRYPHETVADAVERVRDTLKSRLRRLSRR